ncbi:CFL1 Probable ferric reductase transmembrane component [Candida maltosa Xu316]
MYYWSCSTQLFHSVAYCDGDYNFTCACTNPNALATMAGCLAYGHKNTSSNLAQWESNCLLNGEVTFEEGWFDVAYNYYLENAVNISQIPDFNASEKIDYPIIYDPRDIDLWRYAYYQYLGNYDNALYYGSGALAYWLMIMLFGAINAWSRVMFPGLIKKLNWGPINWWREYISMPATFRKKKAQEQKILKIFDVLIPTRYETIVIFLFYGYILAVHCVKMHYVKEVSLFSSKYEFQLRNVADRTGIVATVIMPLVFLFSGRNNFLQWLTGWHFSTFMTYHRHIARVMFWLVVIHAVTFTVEYKTIYAEEVSEPFLYWGIIATVAAGVMLIQAMLFLRRRWYEIFLLLHIVLAAFYIAGTWIHVIDYGYGPFCYATIAPWCFDRAVRLARLAFFGFPKAKVTLMANEVIKVVIPKPSYWKPIPGGHAFIHFLKPTYFWQSHPFTYVDSSDKSSIILFCKVKGGITHSLYKLLVKSPDQTTTIRVGVEGPYGESSSGRYSDTAVFIASGNGIPGIYSELIDIAKHLSTETKQTLKLIWIIRNYNSLEWFAEELEALRGTPVETTIYVTRAETIINDDDSLSKLKTEKEEENHGSIKSRFDHIDFRQGRPSIEEIIADKTQASHGSIAFVTCGHPAMVDEVRYFTCKNINNPEKKRVDFFEQVQVWA